MTTTTTAVDQLAAQGIDPDAADELVADALDAAAAFSGPWPISPARHERNAQPIVWWLLTAPGQAELDMRRILLLAESRAIRRREVPEPTDNPAAFLAAVHARYAKLTRS
jgi:hypothetical protein